MFFTNLLKIVGIQLWYFGEYRARFETAVTWNDYSTCTVICCFKVSRFQSEWCKRELVCIWWLFGGLMFLYALTCIGITSACTVSFVCLLHFPPSGILVTRSASLQSFISTQLSWNRLNAFSAFLTDTESSGSFPVFKYKMCFMHTAIVCIESGITFATLSKLGNAANTYWPRQPVAVAMLLACVWLSYALW